MNGEVVVGEKLTRGMMGYKKSIEQKENQQKYAQSGKNIQVFGLPTNVTDDQVREFFSKYGEIESLSSAKRGDHVNESIFHYNILFKTAEAAANAITNAAEDDKNADKHLSRDNLRVMKYESKVAVQSSGARKRGDK